MGFLNRTPTNQHVLIVCVCVFGIATDAALAQDADPDRESDRPNVEQFMFPPELVLQNAERLKLTTEQRMAIEDQMTKAREKLAAQHDELMAATRKFHENLAQGATKEEVLQRLDEVLDKERLVKRSQLSTWLNIRQLLTAQQLATIRDLKQTFQADQRELRHKIESKIARVQEYVQQRQQVAEPPVELRKKMKAFKALVKVGKVREAHELLDRIVEEFVEPADDN